MDQINRVTRVNLLLIRRKIKGSGCSRIISLLKKIFGKPFKVFRKFGDTANKFIMLFSLYLIYVCVCVYIYFCKYVFIYLYFMCVICISYRTVPSTI